MEVSPRRLSPAKQLRLWWGKARRFYLGAFRPGYIRTQHTRRVGECRRCGACCLMGVQCWFLKNHQPITECKHHTRRPRNCRIFPIDERDLRDRDLIAPDVPCGYHFNGHASANRPAPSRTPES